MFELSKLIVALKPAELLIDQRQKEKKKKEEKSVWVYIGIQKEIVGKNQQMNKKKQMSKKTVLQ